MKLKYILFAHIILNVSLGIALFLFLERYILMWDYSVTFSLLTPTTIFSSFLWCSFFLFNESFKKYKYLLFLGLFARGVVVLGPYTGIDVYSALIANLYFSSLTFYIILRESKSKFLKIMFGIHLFFLLLSAPPFYFFDMLGEMLGIASVRFFFLNLIRLLQVYYLIKEFHGKISFNHLKSDNALQKEMNAGQFSSEKTMETKMKLKGTPFYIAITSGAIFVIGLFMILPDYSYWQDKQRGYWGHDDFSGIKSFMSSTSDGTAWVLGLGFALLVTIVAVFAHFNQTPESVAQTSDNAPPKEKEENSEPPKKKAKSKEVKVEDDIPKQIEELSKLKEKGILTQKEFNAKKKELLDRL